MTARYEICTAGGETAHLVRRRLRRIGEAVETYCGIRRFPGPVRALAHVCHACLTAVNDEITEGRP